MRNRWKTAGRRTFIKATSATALYLPFVRSRAVAQTGEFPVRLIIVSRPSGFVPAPTKDDHRGWDYKWDPSGSERDFTLGSMHGALEPYKSDMVFVKGLDLKSSRSDFDIGLHGRAMRNLLTGTDGGGISVDQFVADALDVEPFKHVPLAVHLSFGDRPYRRANGSGLQLEDNPYSAFDTHFQGFVPDNTSMDEVRARRGSVLDFVRDQIGRLQGELCGDERAKLDAHLQSVREVERQLDGSAFGCAPTPVASGIRVNDVDDRERVFDAQIDIAVSLVACQLTPVIPFAFGGGNGLDADPQSWIRGPDGQRLTRNHHQYAHRDLGGTQEEYESIGEWYVGKFADLIGKLKAVPEGTGTLLDNCIVILTSDQRNGWAHSNTNVPFLVAGKAGGQIETGRFLDYGSRNHNDMLVSLCRLMGVDVDRFGDANFSNGPLPGFADV